MNTFGKMVAVTACVLALVISGCLSIDQDLVIPDSLTRKTKLDELAKAPDKASDTAPDNATNKASENTPQIQYQEIVGLKLKKTTEKSQEPLGTLHTPLDTPLDTLHISVGMVVESSELEKDIPTANRVLKKYEYGLVRTLYPGLELLNRKAGNSPDERISKIDDEHIRLMYRSIHTSAGSHTVYIRYSDDEKSLINEIPDDSSTRSVLSNARAILTRDTQRTGKINLIDIAGMSQRAVRSIAHVHADEKRLTSVLVNLNWNHVGKHKGTAEDPTISVSLDTIISMYMQAYIAGKYVDRSGTAFPKPAQSSTIGNDTIVGFESVVLDAVFDYCTMTPVLKTKTVTPEDKTPTFLVLYPELSEEISSDSNVGITEPEYRLMNFLKGIGAEQSKHLSALIVRSIGGVTLSFIIGGKLSVGDNDTLAKVISTFCSLFVDRVVGGLNYDFFENFSYTTTQVDEKDEEGKKVKKDVLTIEDRDAVANNKNLHINATASKMVLEILKYQNRIAELLSKDKK